MGKIKEFYDKNKKIVIPAAIILVLLIAVGVYFISQPHDNTDKKAESQTEETVDISQDDKNEDDNAQENSKVDEAPVETPAEQADAPASAPADKPSTDKPTGNDNANNNENSGNNSSSSSNSGGNASSKPSKPSHTHSWKDHTATKQVWVSKLVPVYETQKVQVGTNKISLGFYWHCNCGAVIPSGQDADHAFAHIEKGEPDNGYEKEHFREEPIYETQKVQVGTKDEGHYETQTYVDYRYCDCGATK